MSSSLRPVSLVSHGSSCSTHGLLQLARHHPVQEPIRPQAGVYNGVGFVKAQFECSEPGAGSRAPTKSGFIADP